MTKKEVESRYAELAKTLGKTPKKYFKTKGLAQAAYDEMLALDTQTTKSSKKQRGRDRSPVDMPKGESPTLPRKGTLKAQALVMLNKGCTIEDLTKLYQDDFDRRGVAPKTSAKVRAREVILLLHTQNDMGFKEKAGVIKLITE